MGIVRPRPSWQRIVSSFRDSACQRSNRHSDVIEGLHSIDVFPGRSPSHRSRGVPVSAWRHAAEGFILQSKGWTGFSLYSSMKDDAGDIGPVAVDYSSPLEEDRFHELADDVLHRLQDKIEVYADDLSVDGFDLDYSSGVLTVRLGNLGTFVINKQTPNRQIWLSSPVSGPGRYDWSNSKSAWVYRRNNVELVSQLEKEFSDLLGVTIDLSQHDA